ncbi:hypothetical protein AB434_2489 [Heyndrickxia coagulans]|uniref:Uncharacterized protein n=1 Tax=Heyndrickxia coagulans TaxID=1398 RepID=A0AAN0T615_HEYCO|nr:hypothetical protein SB48_HM08orf04488 [Heyndrickxia coagulans]AKN54894.1 hypothetical protein AB434_2489 [Heyndrickxia coagulans]KGB31072.1 hypothetical protein IE89_01500 [Heyndrickxia coagulans]
MKSCAFPYFALDLNEAFMLLYDFITDHQTKSGSSFFCRIERLAQLFNFIVRDAFPFIQL